MNKRIFVFHNGKTYPGFHRWVAGFVPAFISRKVEKLENYFRTRRNPRTQDYMERVANQMYSDFTSDQVIVVESDYHLPIVAWRATEEIVLLWPDANGTGWTRIERQLFKMKQRSARLIVLNGRRRRLVLDRMTWRIFQWKRFLEKTFVVESLALFLFILISPWMALWNFLRPEEVNS